MTKETKTAILSAASSPVPVTQSIRIRNAYKRYSPSNVILNGLNLTVPDKSIYGLLGPSGCGKSTLLNCIVGKTALDSGSIELNLKRRADIGYMPQNLSLHVQMTINENFYFYGLLYGMSLEKIQKRSADLKDFLELPPADRFIVNLSGGQQRRVSIAVALLHDPKIIILDEPTVGLDPVLSQSIWNRLLEMANNGRTIIITTHYIQEAKQAHTIGLMREGKLLAEESPSQLIENYSCSGLEEAFFKLSYKQEIESTHEDGDHLEFPEKSKKIMAHFDDDKIRFSKTKFNGVMYKNLTLLKREYLLLVFVIVLPVLQSYLFNVAIGGKPKNLNLAIINDEISPSDCSPSYYDGCFLSEDTIYNENILLSCLLLDYLKNETYNFIEYRNDSVALEDVRKNKAWALLHFTSNYTSSLAYRVTYGPFVHEEDLESGFVNTWIDLSNKYIGNLVKLDIARAMFAFLERIMQDCNLNPKIASIPVRLEKPIFGSTSEHFLSYASNAILCLICFFLPAILSMGLILTEKVGGTMERMMVSGVSITEILLSAILIQIVVHFIQTSLAMIVIYWWFDNPLEGSIVTLSILMLLTGICGMFFGFMLGVVNKDIIGASYAGIGINLALCLTSGLLWPIEAEHYILRSISPFLPLTWTADATRAICSKNLSFFHPLVLRGFASTIMWNLIFVLIMFLFIKFRKDGLVVQN